MPSGVLPDSDLTAYGEYVRLQKWCGERGETLIQGVMSIDRAPTAIEWTQERDEDGDPFLLGRHPLGDFRIWDHGFTRGAFAVDGLGHSGYLPPTFDNVHAAKKACWEALRPRAQPGRV